MWTHWSPPASWTGIKNGAAMVSSSLTIPQNVKGRITVWSSSFPPSRRHTQVGGKRVPTQISTTEVFLTTEQWNYLKWDEWIHEMWCIHTMERYSAIKVMKCWSTLHHGWTLRYDGKWKKPVTKDYLDFIEMGCPEQGNPWRWKIHLWSSGAGGWKKRRMKGRRVDEDRTCIQGLRRI